MAGRRLTSAALQAGDGAADEQGVKRIGSVRFADISAGRKACGIKHGTGTGAIIISKTYKEKAVQ
jgi:hypothetical protein